MQLTIIELKEDIIKRFGKENGGTYFGIITTTYNYDKDGLIIQVGHYRDKGSNKAYEITINEVVSCRITQESYIHEFEEEIWEGFAFFWINKYSRFKRDFNSWSLYEKIFGNEKFYNLKAYRIGAQNNFIDVLTTAEPIIKLIEMENI